MSNAQSLFNSILIKFLACFTSVALFMSVGYIIDAVTAALAATTIYDVGPEWASTDRSGTIINIIYMACWIPAFVAIVAPWIRAVRKEEEQIKSMEYIQDPYYEGME